MATVLERPRYTEERTTDTGFTIKSGIPVPPRDYSHLNRQQLKYPFAAMDVGDCFDVVVWAESKRDGGAMTAVEVQSRVAVSSRYFTRRYKPNARFTTRKIDGGQVIRVWRTA